MTVAPPMKIKANDLHRHIINLARVVRDPVRVGLLEEMLSGLLFHPDELAEAQRACQAWEDAGAGSLWWSEGTAHGSEPDISWAAAYFVSVWMGRGGQAGTAAELSQSPSVRWTEGEFATLRDQCDVVLVGEGVVVATSTLMPEGLS